MSKPVARDPRTKLKDIVDRIPKHHDWLVVEDLVTSTSDDANKLTIGELRRLLDAE